jgi:hypothetical protein
MPVRTSSTCAAPSSASGDEARVAFAKIGVLMASAARHGKPLHPTNLHVNKGLFPDDTVQSKLPDPEWLERWLDHQIRFDRLAEGKVINTIFAKLSTLYDRTIESANDLNRLPQGADRSPAPAARHRLRSGMAPGLRSPLAWGVLAVGLTATAALAWATRTAHEEKTREEFHRRVDAALYAIRSRMISYEYVARAGAAFLAARSEPTKAEWTAYVGAMRIERDFPGMALAYGKPAEIEADAPRRLAMERARDTGEASLSGKIALPGEAFRGQPPQQAGVVLFMPVYRKGSAIGTVEERRAALQGYVYSPIRVNDALVIGSHTLRDLGARALRRRGRLRDGGARRPRGRAAHAQRDVLHARPHPHRAPGPGGPPVDREARGPQRLRGPAVAPARHRGRPSAGVVDQPAGVLPRCSPINGVRPIHVLL